MASIRTEVLPDLTLREGLDDESHFILNSWLLSYKHTKCGTTQERADAAGIVELAGRALAHEQYFNGQQAVISTLAAHRRVLVVCDATDPNFVLGWACGELRELSDGSPELVVDYVYVKHAYRKHGIARGLLQGLGWKPGMRTLCTHWTKPCNFNVAKYGLVPTDIAYELTQWTK